MNTNSILRLRELAEADDDWRFLVRANECEVYRVTNETTAQAAVESGWQVIDLIDVLTAHDDAISTAANAAHRMNVVETYGS